MRTEYDFFIINREHLKEKRTFPFQIYIYNPVHEKFSLFLNGNRPLSKELETLMDYLLEKGGKIAVLKKQRRTFLNAQEYHESEIPSLATRELHALEKERLMNIKLMEMHNVKNGPFYFQTEFELACENDDFNKIIDQARIEILTFSVTHSQTVSLALELTKRHMTRDNFLNRIVATSYLLAKAMDIAEEAALADIICGAYLSHIGYTQLPFGIIRTSSLNLFNKDKKLFEKHTILGHHLLKKSGVQLSERAKKIILDHHERVSGAGYPSMKFGESIELLSLIVGSVAHLFEYSSGKINGARSSMKSIIISIKNKNYIPGLEFDFGEKVFNCLVTLINTDKIENKKEKSDNHNIETKAA